MLEKGQIVYIPETANVVEDTKGKFGIIEDHRQSHGYDVIIFGLSRDLRYFSKNFPFILCDLNNKLMKLIYETNIRN